MNTYKNCRFLFLNLDNDTYGRKENFVKIWQIKWNWRSVKFKIVRIDFWVTFSVCCHPKFLLPWQRDVRTSPLYWPNTMFVSPFLKKATWLLNTPHPVNTSCYIKRFTHKWKRIINWICNSFVREYVAVQCVCGTCTRLDPPEQIQFWNCKEFLISERNLSR